MNAFLSVVASQLEEDGENEFGKPTRRSGTNTNGWKFEKKFGDIRRQVFTFLPPPKLAGGSRTLQDLLFRSKSL